MNPNQKLFEVYSDIAHCAQQKTGVSLAENRHTQNVKIHDVRASARKPYNTPFTLRHFLPHGERYQMINTKQGKPISESTNIASIYLTSFFLLKLIKNSPDTNANPETATPKPYTKNLFPSKSLKNDDMTTPVNTYFDISIR